LCSKDFMSVCPLDMTHLKTNRINITNSCAITKTVTQVSLQDLEGRRHPLDKAATAYQSGKGGTPITADHLGIEGFEVAVGGLMKSNQNSHDFTQTQAPSAVSAFYAIGEGRLLRDIAVAEVIDMAEQGF